MIQKKVCILGAFAVGKTSMVRRLVHSVFSERYLTTVGVKIDKGIVRVGDDEVALLLWDLQGEDDFQSVRPSYLRGASGYVLVADGTRRSTLDTAIRLRAVVTGVVGGVPHVLVLNKVDLGREWEIDAAALDDLARDGWTVLQVSAKTGEGVEEAFRLLASRLVEA